MNAQSVPAIAAIGFAGGLGGAALVWLLHAARTRAARGREEAARRRERLRPDVERVLRAAVRFERCASSWSPGTRPALPDARRERVRELAGQLDEEARLAALTMRWEGATHALAGLLALRGRVEELQRALARPASGFDAATRATAAVLAALPDVEAVLLTQLEDLTPAPARSPRRRPARTGGRSGWMGTLDPLRHPVFRWLWLATLASQLGSWFHNVGAVDLMTLVAPSALLLTLVQTATSLPGLLLALPSGALADLVDRRRLLVVASAWMCGVSALMAVTAYAHLVSSWWLLGLTFALGVGAIAGLPAWQAIVPEVVPGEQLAPAVTLESLAINVPRTVAPAVGGLAVALAGPAAAFALSAVVLAFATVVVLGWRREAPAAAGPRVGMAAAVRLGVRYSLLSGPIRTILVRAAGFIVCASALWALLPIRGHQFGLGFAGYSGLLCSLGAGGMLCGVLLTHVRRWLGPDALVLAGSFVFMTASLGVAVVPVYAVAVVLMFGAGTAWVASMSTFNVAIQRAAPEWVRGRVLAAWMVTHMGSLAVGSAVWGVVATRAGLVFALDVAGVLLAATVALAAPWALDAVPAETPAAGPALAPAPRRPRLVSGGRSAGPPTPPLPAVARQARPGDVAPAGPRGPDLTGRELGPYRLEERIGGGTLGDVYRARHTALGAPRAVRALRPDLAGDPRLRSRFLHGAVSVARLRHPNVVAVHDCGTEDGVPYVVMEYVESLTLAEHLRRLPGADRVRDPMVSRCVSDVAAALDHLHACGAVHGGLRPAKVLVRTADARAMLSDCAIPPALGAVLTPRSPDGRAYVAPERWGRAPTAAVDVYAFAALLYEIATGGPPAARALAAPGDGPGPALPVLPVLARGMAASPEDRHRSAGELAAEYLAAVS
jgi:MFS family permease